MVEIEIIQEVENVQNNEPSKNNVQDQNLENASNPKHDDSPKPAKSQKFKKVIDISMCGYKSTLVTLAICDMITSFLTGISCVSLSGTELYLLFVAVASMVFLVIGIILILGVLRRNKICCWIFIIFDALAVIASIVLYIMLFWNSTRIEKKVTFSFWMFLVVIYKIYESLCVYYFMKEKPRRQGYVIRNGDTLVMYTGPDGENVTGQPVVYYGNPYVGGGGVGLGLVGGLALGSMMHGHYI